MSVLGDLLFIAILTGFEGFFVAAEIALVSIRRSRVDQLVDERRRGALRVRRLRADPGRFLAVSQLGLTTIGFFASAYAAVSLVDALAGLLAGIPALAGGAQAIALVIVTLLLALFTIVFAELVPKTLALAHPEPFATTLAPAIDILGRVLGPLISLLTGCHPGDHPRARRRRDARVPDHGRGAAPDRRAGWRGGGPRGRGRADDPRGHRAR